MFESRPIWSRNAVKANINIQPDKLKLLLPVVAYYMVITKVYHAYWEIIDWNILNIKYSTSKNVIPVRRNPLIPHWSVGKIKINKWIDINIKKYIADPEQKNNGK